MPAIDTITDALAAAQKRGALPTSLGTAELRELGADILARSVFTARGTNAVFVDMIKALVEALAAGDMNEATARVTLLETLRALGYTPEGGFPDAPEGSVPPAVRGTLQDLSSRRRLDLIVETQRGLMIGAGQKNRGSTPDRLELFPAWELVRQLSVREPRDWQARWTIAGGRRGQDVPATSRMIALKGDPIWGELGSPENFEDALSVDYPPFAFNSGMGWLEISKEEVARLGITGPQGESPEEFLATRPATLGGRQELPSPTLSVRDMDPEILREFQKSTGAEVSGGKATLPAVDYEARRREREARDVREAGAAYEGRAA